MWRTEGVRQYMERNINKFKTEKKKEDQKKTTNNNKEKHYRNMKDGKASKEVHSKWNQIKKCGK